MLAIALISLKEALRKRILLVAVLFGAAVMLTAPLWPALNDADRVKLVEDISLGAMSALGMIMAVFAAAWALPADIAEKRIYTLASKPVRPHAILLGKLLGFLAAFALVVLLMAAVSDLVIRIVSTHSVVEVSRDAAPLLAEGEQIASAECGLKLRVLGEAGGFYEVALPPDIGGNRTTGRVSAADVTAPRRRWLAARRLVPPAGWLISNTGRARCTSDTLVLETADAAVGEVWRFTDIDPARLPPGEEVAVLLRVPGIYGSTADGRWGRFDQEAISEFGATIRAADPASGRTIERLQTRAAWTGNAFAMKFTLPRQMLLAGSLQVAIIATDPEFIHAGPVSISRGRVIQWRFRGLRLERFPAGDIITGELNVTIHRSDGLAQVDRQPSLLLRIAEPSHARSETVAASAGGRTLRFTFSRELVSPDGGVDVTLLDVPEPFVAVVPTDGTAVRLVEKPVLFEWSYLKAAAYVYCRVMLVATIAISASTFLSGGVAALVAFFACLCGVLANFLNRILLAGPGALIVHDYTRVHGEETVRAAWPVVKVALKVLAALTPNLGRLTGKSYVIDGLDVPGRALLGGIGTTLIYCAVCLAVAHVVFNRKEVG